jgi:hypothetical protein
MRHDLETVLHNVFAPDKVWRLDPITKKLLAVEWVGIRDKLDRMLDLDYPRPQRVGDSIVIEGHATITFDEIERKFTVTI